MHAGAKSLDRGYMLGDCCGPFPAASSKATFLAYRFLQTKRRTYSKANTNESHETPERHNTIPKYMLSVLSASPADFQL